MAYIAPNTTIHFLEKIMLKPNYEHSYYFRNTSEQEQFFLSKVKYTKGTQSYQRVGIGKLRVEMTMEEAYQVNYIMFKNTSFENKWFYAFIVSDPIYVNNTTVEIRYQIDVLQTWMCDYNIKPCYVERNHTLTDVAGENLEDEGLFTGYIETVSETNTLSGIQLGCIVTSKPIPNIAYGKVSHITGSTIIMSMANGSHCLPLYQAKNNMSFTEYTQAGQASTLYYYYNIPLSKQSFNAIQNKQRYKLFSPSYALKKTYGVELYYSTVDYSTPITVQEILYAINLPYLTDALDHQSTLFTARDYGERCFYYDSDGATPTGIVAIPVLGTSNTSIFTPNDVYAIYQYPIEFADYIWSNNAMNLYNNSNGLSISDEQIISSPYKFSEYTPNNKKLYTYPYNYVEVTDNEGSVSEYKYELSTGRFRDNGVNCFTYKIFGQYGLTPTATLIPTFYLEERENFCHSFTNKNYIQCAYIANQYNVWRQQNSQEFLGKAINAGLQIALTAAGAPSIQYLGAKQKNSEHGDTKYTADTRQYIDASNRADKKLPNGDFDEYEVLPKGGVGGSDVTERFHNYNHQAFVRTYTQPRHKNKSESWTNQERNEDSWYTRQGWDSIGSAEKLYNVNSIMAQRSDAMAITNSVTAPTANLILNNAIRLKNITIKKKQITPLYAQRIDKYFDMFGYKINRVETPNRNARKYWTYVKTTNCNIELINSIPTSDVEEICNCYNSGITFWTRTDNSDIGDYNLKNELLNGHQDDPISLITFFKSDDTQIPFAFNPLVLNNTISFSDSTNVLKIKVYGYADVHFRGELIPETVDADEQSKLFVINGLQSGDNLIQISGSKMYNFTVNYTPVNVLGVSIYRGYNPLSDPVVLTPSFRPTDFSYAAQITTDTATDNLVYFYSTESPFTITANGSITFLDANTAQIELIEGYNNIVLTANGFSYTFTLQFIVNSGVMNGVYADQSLTQPIPMTPSTFFPTTYQYSINASVIPQNRTIYVKIPYPVNNITLNGTYISGDENGVFELNLLPNMVNALRWTQNGFNNAQLTIDLR